MRTEPDDLVAQLRAAGCVFAEDEAALLRTETADPATRQALVARRVAGEPLEQVVGWVEFDGLRLHVEPGVFIPRRRTRLLVETTLRAVDEVPAPVVVELCCGIGAVAAAVLARRPDACLVASDLDPVAVRCTEHNLAGTEAIVGCGDLYDAVPSELAGRVDVVVANAPYVPTDEIPGMPPEARDHEPALALDGGADGLDVARRIVAGAPDWLRPGGTLVVETSDRQAEALGEELRRAGLRVSLLGDEALGAWAMTGLLEPLARRS